MASAVTTYSTHPVRAIRSHCYSPHPLKSAARQTMCHLELSLWVGGVGVQRGDWGANGGESRLCRPGRGLPRLPAGPRARSAGAPGSCAPLPGSRPRLRGCGLVVSGREAGERRASVPPAGARARGAGQARSRRAGELRGAGPRRCTSGASGGRRAASARGA